MLPQHITLRDGNYLLRALDAGDSERLQAFFYSHTPESIHLRYGFMVTQMSGERAQELTGVDQTRECAIALFDESSSQPLIHAVARYCLDSDGRSAEVAFIVREAKQRLGMAALLVGKLIQTARERGLDSLWAQVLRENTGALELLEKMKFKKTGAEDNNLILRLELKGPPPKSKRR